MLSILKYGYKVTKPRIRTDNIKALQNYRKQLYEARVRAHKEAVKYLNRIQDQFLEKYEKQTGEKHFNNQCTFRAKIGRNSYILYESMQKNKLKHEQKLQKIQKYIREQQIKRLNRDRIRKILQYESANYWLTAENISQKFITDKVLPEYIGTTQYYHKLHSQALAYEELDFDMLHKLSSTEQTIEFKNRMLIPIYKEVLILMKLVKFSDQERGQKQYLEAQIKLQKKYNNDAKGLERQLGLIKRDFEQKIQQIRRKKLAANEKKQYLKAKVKQFILLLKKWKQYTDVLGMTSSQILKLIGESKNQSSIRSRQKSIQTQIEKKRDKTFVEAVQQDTQDQQVTLASFLNKTQKQPQSPLTQQKTQFDSFNEQLASLLKQQQAIFKQISSEIKQKQDKLLNQTKTELNLTKYIQQTIAFTQQLSIDQGFLKETQTTSSIQILKQQFKNDQTMQSLFNIAGQLTIEYPKLFNKIWEIQLL